MSPAIRSACKHCSQQFFPIKSYRVGQGNYCSLKCSRLGRRLIPLGVRFQKYLSPKNANGCILWTGSLNSGYGEIQAEYPNRRMILAHRAAWELANGPIPDGLCVLHRCDVPACVSVEHLFLGTNDDNVADCVSKSRQAKGKMFPHTILTPEAVLEIRKRRANGTTQKALAIQFGVDPSTISDVVRRKYWKHLP